MLKLKLHHTPRISNSLALLAAMVLLVSALASFSGSGLTSKVSADQTAGIETIATQTVTSDTRDGNSNTENKSFKVSLFLFRTN